MKIICVYHSRDLDGWMSAAIVKKWAEENYKCPTFQNHIEKYELVESNILPTGSDFYFLGWDYGDVIPDLSEYDKVIMCDVSFPVEIMKELMLSKTKNKGFYNSFIWIDHHISAIKAFETITDGFKEIWISGLRDTKFAACELTWKYFFPDEKMPEIVRLLGRYDCFGHKGTDEEQEVLEFQYGARQSITSYEEAHEYLNYCIQDYNHGESDTMDEINVKGKAIYKYLCVEAKQIYNKAFEIELLEPDITQTDESGKSFVQYPKRFLCINHERFYPINFGIDYHKEGYDGFACFWYKDGKWIWSLYNDNGEVDCSAIAKQYGGGGHKGAAGFVQSELIFLNE